MAFTMDEKDGCMVLKLKGPMTIYEAVEIRDELLKQFEGSGSVTLALDAVTECDAAGIQLLWAARKTAKDEGKKFCIESLSKSVVEAIAQVGLNIGDFEE